MYGKIGAGTATTGAATLPITGAMNIGWAMILGVTLVVVGLALYRLAPRPSRHRG